MRRASGPPRIHACRKAHFDKLSDRRDLSERRAHFDKLSDRWELGYSATLSTAACVSCASSSGVTLPASTPTETSAPSPATRYI